VLSHVIICYVRLLSEQSLLPNFLEQSWKLSSIKLICKRTDVNGSAATCKTGSSRPKTVQTAENIECDAND